MAKNASPSPVISVAEIPRLRYATLCREVVSSRRDLTVLKNNHQLEAPPMWTLGELHDTCNDYCQFLGYSGCDLAEMETVDTEEELAVEMQNLGKTCLVNGSIWNEIATYEPEPSGCYLNRNALDCDSNRQEKHQPLCYCIGTTTTTTPAARPNVALDSPFPR